METTNFGTGVARAPAEALVPQDQVTQDQGTQDQGTQDQGTQEGEQLSEALVPQEVPAPDSRITVVICDDHPAYAQGLALLLEREVPSFKVLGAATKATEAIPLVSSLNPQVVLMDIRMPTIDGIEATRQIKTLTPETKVVMLTVSDEAGDLYEAMRAGASGFITKDREVAEIAEAVRSVMRGHLTIPSDLAARFLKDVTNADITSTLTEIETHLLTGFTQGKTNKQIAQTLEVSERTVCRRIDDLYRKLHVTDRIQAAIWAVQQGFGTPNPNGAKRKPGRPLGSGGPRKPGRPLKVQSLKRPPKSLVGTPTPTSTEEPS